MEGEEHVSKEVWNIYLFTFESLLTTNNNNSKLSRCYYGLVQAHSQSSSSCEGVCSIPRVVLTRKRKCVTVDTVFMQSIVLSRQQIKVLEEFKRFFLCTIIRKPEFDVKSNGFLFVPVMHHLEANPFSVENVTQLIEKLDAKALIDQKGRDVSQFMCGKVVVTTYNDIAYVVHKVDFSLSPLSTFSTKKGQALTFHDYYTQKRGLHISDLNQPLLVHAGYSSVIGVHSQDISSLELVTADLDEEPLIFLIPEFCHLTAISAEIQYYGRLLPYVWSHMQNYFKLNRFERHNKLHFKNKRLLKQALTHPSYSNENEGPLTNNQRLEFIGDAVLDFVVTTRIFSMFPTAPEGRLTCLKSCFVNNTFLALLAEAIGLKDFIIVAENQVIIYASAEKTLADAFEAIIAALFLDQGIEAALNFYTQVLFMNTNDNPLLDYWKHFDHEATTHLVYPPSNLESLFVEVENRIGIQFKDKSLIIQCFTHPSYFRWGEGSESISSMHSANYQRMEFLGDTILELIVSTYLFTNYPTATEGQMSMCRAQIVNNDTLAECIKFLGLDKFLLHRSPFFTFDGPRLQKASADIFESLLGAIYLDQGFASCTTFVHQFLLNRTTVNPYTVVLDPKSQYQHLVQCEGRGLPVYKILSLTQTLYGTIYEIGVYVQGELIATAEGQTKRESARIAAQRAIEAYLKDDHYVLASEAMEER